MLLREVEPTHAGRQLRQQGQRLRATQTARRRDACRRQVADHDPGIVEGRPGGVLPQPALELVDLDSESGQEGCRLLLAGIEPAEEIGGSRLPLGRTVEEIVGEHPRLRREDRPFLDRIARATLRHGENLAQRQERSAAHLLETLR